MTIYTFFQQANKISQKLPQIFFNQNLFLETTNMLSISTYLFKLHMYFPWQFGNLGIGISVSALALALASTSALQ